jgi:hypothetical protein
MEDVKFQLDHVASKESSVVKRGGVLEGDQLQPSILANYCHGAGWQDKNLEIAVATCLGESNGFVGAYNDNKDDAGKVLSRDCGLFEINIPASQIGSDYEIRLRNDPLFNVQEAHRLWVKWGGGHNNFADDTVAWNHWVAFKSGVATDPNAGGYYIWRALRGIANYRGGYWGCGNPPASPAFYYQGGKNVPPGH